MNPIHMPTQPITRNFTLVDGQTNSIVVREHYAGDDLVLRFSVVDDAGDPVDISVWTTRTFKLFPKGSLVADLTKTPALVGGGTGGVMTVTIAGGDTSALEDDKRLEVEVSGVDINLTIATGLLEINKTY